MAKPDKPVPQVSPQPDGCRDSEEAGRQESFPFESFELERVERDSEETIVEGESPTCDESVVGPSAQLSGETGASPKDWRGLLRTP